MWEGPFFRSLPLPSPPPCPPPLPPSCMYRNEVPPSSQLLASFALFSDFLVRILTQKDVQAAPALVGSQVADDVHVGEGPCKADFLHHSACGFGKGGEGEGGRNEEARRKGGGEHSDIAGCPRTAGKIRALPAISRSTRLLTSTCMIAKDGGGKET